jgi:hypothetical protein
MEVANVELPARNFKQPGLHELLVLNPPQMELALTSCMPSFDGHSIMVYMGVGASKATEV